MPLDITRARDLLRRHDLRSLFIEEMGWDNPGHDLSITVDGTILCLRAIAQKRGFGVYLCPPIGDYGAIPEHAIRGRIEEQVRKEVHEHLLVFVNAERT